MEGELAWPLKLEHQTNWKGEPEASPGRELHADELLSEVVEVLTVGHSGERE